MMEAIISGKSVLVFGTTKNDVESTAKHMGKFIQYCLAKGDENRFPQLATIINLGVQKQAVEYFIVKTSSKDEALQSCITYGIGWHHAGSLFCAA